MPLFALRIGNKENRVALADVKEKGISTFETLTHSIKGHLQGIKATLEYFEN